MQTTKHDWNAWLVWEDTWLKANYERPIPMTEILKMLPRHTRGSIKVYARVNLGLKRPRGIRDNPRPLPAWDRIKAVIEHEALTRDQIADRLSVTKQAVGEVLGAHRKEWYVAKWEPPVGRGKPTEMVLLGDRSDEPYQRRTRNRKAAAARAINPFAPVAGFVQIPVGQRGRVIKHLHDDEQEAA
ncbi:MAG: hypothetical protein WCA85_25870 [Paraburkholderia sp.]|uniref:hypothetical protein n=1 Tax=Paraburkholderia sp. TaxID=1926495 RepID=UPI003C667E04